MHPPLVLIVDDDDNDCELALRLFRKHHVSATVVVTHDGRAALDFLQRRGDFADRPSGNPALLLVDRRMPAMDGPELVRRIRQDDALARIPIIGMVGNLKELEATLRLVDGVVRKPLRYDRLIAVAGRLGVNLRSGSVVHGHQSTG